jgi:genome maintenance exonuclease 1
LAPALVSNLRNSVSAHLSRGKKFHECLQRHFNGETVVKSEISPEVIEIWKSIEPLLDSFKAPGVLIEQEVAHPYLFYKGIVDCVSFHNSTLSVIEWKKSDRQKKTLNLTFDAPVQLIAYIGALNASREEFLENPIKSGVVVVAYNDGQKADLFELKESELRKYWKIWANRVQEYWVRYRDKTMPDAI